MESATIILPSTARVMAPSIQGKIDELTIQLDEILEATKAFRHEQLNFKPSASEWSILQVIQHLITAETHTNLYLRKKILAGKDLENAGIGTKIKATLIRSLMATPFKFKAPAAVDVKMDEVYDYDTLVKEWRHQRNEMISFLTEVDETMVNKLLFKHGSGIRMNLEQMLKWTYVHADRHSKQIKRITNNSKFPRLPR